MQKISTRGMSREEWLEERKKSLGGSDMGAVLGLNRYRSPYTVWAEKTGRIGEEPENEAMLFAGICLLLAAVLIAVSAMM